MIVARGVVVVHTDTSAEATEAEEPSRPVRRRDRWFRYTLPGAYTALVFACLSFTPSLLPRGPVVQGLIVGIDAAFGYAVGVLGAWIWREFADRPARTPRAGAWRIFFIVAAVTLVASLVLGIRWQAQIRELMDVSAPNPLALVLLPVVAVLIFVGLVALGRVIRNGYRWLSRLFSRWMGARAARALGWGLVAILVVFTINGVLINGFLNLADQTFSVRDTITAEGVEQPTTPLRSGSDESLVEWDSLGREGRTFTGRGPSTDQIAQFTGTSATEPIRAYAGMASAADVEERARLAVDDLERAGGFERAYLLVVTTTGSGWVVPSSVDTFEYMTGGDSAVVAIQYSYLPSWISYLVDQQRAREAGRELYDAVYERWSALPADARPELLVFGESLGSFGAETAFSGEFDLANRTDGALLVGPPSFNTLYRQFTDDREPESPEVEPVYRDGRVVRFANEVAEELPPEDEPWTRTRVLYLLHPSDPIVWWSPQLLLSRPDWLDEGKGRDVLDEMVWIPFVTFWQVTLDLPSGTAVPSGHGHSYEGDHVDGWVEVLQPAGWTAEKTSELRELVTGS
jgi:uncharacterized membrane protein